ncbi:MAG: hypothetical protein GX927_00020 [Lentisphaerae bacterium]|nr:hypothetical protein [Lentisphaerota bacterium]
MLESGTFTLGCNYWASHAGIYMWRNWQADVIKADFARLAELGLEHLRIFPLWPAFQPLSIYYGGGNTPRELVWKDGKPLPEDGSTVDPVMLERLRFVCDCAHENGMQVVIALVTGWMSGRLFAPPAFETCNLHTNPRVIYYQTRLIKEIINALKEHPAVAMWESGNETNCMAASNRDEFRLWINVINDAIRIADPTRPIPAGMHGLQPSTDGDLRFDSKIHTIDLGRCCDFLTTHPYPLFTSFASTDALSSYKSVFHAVAENSFFGDIGGKPCFAEEAGTLSNVIGGEKTAAKYLDRMLKNLFFHDHRGLYWWCAFDQDKLDFPPYTWCAVERELGLFNGDMTLKPVAKTIRDFAKFRKQLPQVKLPPPDKQATVILTTQQDAWASAFGAFLLASQAHFTPQFRFAGQTLPDNSLYIVPSVNTIEGIPPGVFQELMQRAKAGATVFVSADSALFSPFTQAFGLESIGWENASGCSTVCFEGEEFPINRQTRFLLQPTTANMLASDEVGNPVFTEMKYGKGKVYFFALPLEKHVAKVSHATDLGYWKVYSRIANGIIDRAPMQLNHAPQVTMTIRPITPDEVFVTLQNNGEEKASLPKPKWKTVQIWPKNADMKNLEPGDWRVIHCKK